MLDTFFTTLSFSLSKVPSGFWLALALLLCAPCVALVLFLLLSYKRKPSELHYLHRSLGSYTRRDQATLDEPNSRDSEPALRDNSQRNDP